MLVRSEAMGISDELERLHELHERGALSEDEFTVAKAAVIRRDHPEIGETSPEDVSQWAILLHLSQFLVYFLPPFGLVAPIVIWQYKKNEMPEIDDHGKVVTNWVLSAMVYLVASIVLCLVVVGIPMLLAVMILSIVYPVIGAVKAARGQVWRYPLTIDFIK
jgi:uncharacterized Tic20 family protein